MFGTTETLLFYDGHGNTVATATKTGTRTNAYSYRPFGESNEALPVNATGDLFVGRWHKKLDTQSALILMGARPYDPMSGRFLSVDPVDGGAANAYDYSLQDPVNNYDLDGRKWTPGAGVGGGWIASGGAVYCPGCEPDYLHGLKGCVAGAAGAFTAYLVKGGGKPIVIFGRLIVGKHVLIGGCLVGAVAGPKRVKGR